MTGRGMKGGKERRIRYFPHCLAYHFVFSPGVDNSLPLPRYSQSVEDAEEREEQGASDERRGRAEP